MSGRSRNSVTFATFVFSILTAGCLGVRERHGSTPNRRPAMPTVALPEPREPEEISEREILTAAVRAARAGDSARLVMELRLVADPSRRATIADEVFEQIDGIDPYGRARLALVLGDEFQHVRLVEKAGRDVARARPEALTWAAGLPSGKAARQMARAIVEERVNADPRAAIDQILSLEQQAAREDLLVLAAAAWARRDQDAAIDWLRGRPENELKSRLTTAVGFEVAQSNPSRALEIAEMLPEGRDRWLLLSAIGQTWVAIDAGAAVAWAGKLPAGEPRDAAFAGIDTGFGLPVSRRVASAPGTRRGVRTRGGVAAAAAFPIVNSPAFEAWLASQPREMSRDEAILEYVRQRGGLEPQSIEPLLNAMSPGHLKEQAIEAYVEGLLASSPLEAARWVRSLPRSERSDELMEKTARRWLMINPEAAVDWIEQSTLPLHKKEQLLREAGRLP